MLGFFYNFWGVITAVSAILGILSFVVDEPFRGFSSKNDDESQKPKLKRKHLIALIVFFLPAIYSWFVRENYVYVPMVIGLSTDNAKETLVNNNLNMELSDEQEDLNKAIADQEPSADTLVKKGTSVICKYKTGDGSDDIEAGSGAFSDRNQQNEIEVGEFYSFGRYEQDNNEADGKEFINWKIIDKDDNLNRILLISEFALDCQPFYEEVSDETVVTWEKSSLRQWLNDAFLFEAFNEKERTWIQYTDLDGVSNKIFLLSKDEAMQYFGSDKERQCKVTDYAVTRGAFSDDSSIGWWWLRSPGSTFNNNKNAAVVRTYGGIDKGGFYVNDSEGSVRPALWLDIAAFHGH